MECILILIVAFLYPLTVKPSSRQSTATSPPWYIHFDKKTGTHNTGNSSNFISTPASGETLVSVGNGGSFDLQDPGTINLGVDSELKATASSNNIPAKFSVFNYAPGKSFYLKFSIKWDGSNTGEWYCFIGNGNSYSNESIYTDAEVFSGFRITYAPGGNLTIGVKNGTPWASLPGLQVGIKQNTVYVIEIYGNNSTAALNYTYGTNLTGCGTQTVPSNTMDVFVNGFRAGNDLAKGRLPDNLDVNAFMFYGVNSPGNLATYWLDDIIYSNTISSTVMTPAFQPSSLTFSDTTTSSHRLTFTAAHGNPSGYIVLRKAGSFPESIPQDFTNYAAGSTLGDAYVVYAGSNLAISETTLSSGTEYFYRIYAFNGSGNCRNYLSEYPLEGSSITFNEEDLAAFRSKRNGGWQAPSSWDYEYLPGKFKSSSVTPSKKNKSITILRNHIISSGTLETKNLVIEQGGRLVIDGNLTIEDGANEFDVFNEGSINITGALQVAGTIKNFPNSKVEFSGPGDQQIPQGVYYNLSATTGGIKNLSGDVVVKENIELNNAMINTGEFTLTLDSTALLKGENNSNYIKGKIKIAKKVNKRSENFNGLGLKIDATSNQQNLGNVVVIRSTGSPTFVGASSSIARNWSIEPEMQPKKVVKVTFEWLEADEQIPFDLQYMRVWKSTDKGTTWTGIEDYKSASNRSITVSTSSFSDWTVSDFNNVLPVSFQYFKGQANGRSSANLVWEIATEKIHGGFDIEKSPDAINFQKIAHVEASQIPSTTFDFSDENFNNSAYYRIKYNGHIKDLYSNILFIENASSDSDEIDFYPNPFNNSSLPKFSTANPEDKLEVSLLSSNGDEILRMEGSVGFINKELSESLNNLKEGLYIIKAFTGIKTLQLKIIKEK